MVDEFYEVTVDYFQDMKITRGSKYDCLSIVSPGFTEICYSNMRYAVRSLFQFWISKMPSLIRRLTTIVWLISLISKIVLRLYQDCYKTRRFGRQTADVCLPRTLSQFQNLAIDNIAHYNHEYQFLALAFLSTSANLVLSEESHNIRGRMTTEVCGPCGQRACDLNECSDHHPFLCIKGNAIGGCNKHSDYWPLNQ
jgi:hypothetical protein